MNDNEIIEMLEKNLNDNIKLDFADVLERIDKEKKKNTPVEVNRSSRRWIVPLVSSLAACVAVGTAVMLFSSVSNAKYSDSTTAAPMVCEESAEETTNAAADACVDDEVGAHGVSVTDDRYSFTNETLVPAEKAELDEVETYSTGAISLFSGNYVMRNDDGREYGYYPTLTLNAENRSFSFYTDPLSSYIHRGSYSIDASTLICKDNESTDVYYFSIIDSERVSFIKEGSADVIHYNDYSATVVDGTVFELKSDE